VQYFIPTDPKPQYSKVSADVTILQSGKPYYRTSNYHLRPLCIVDYDGATPPGLSREIGAAIGCTVLVFCSVLVAATVTLCLLVIKTRQRVRAASADAQCSFHAYQRIQDLSSPERDADPMEISRSLLKIHDQIGGYN